MVPFEIGDSIVLCVTPGSVKTFGSVFFYLPVMMFKVIVGL